MTQDQPPPPPPGQGNWDQPLTVDPISGEVIGPAQPSSNGQPDHPPQSYAPQPYPTQAYPAPQYGQPNPPWGAYPPAQAPYGGGYPPPWPMPRPTNGMAIAALILGILWVYWLGSILALVFGYIARSQIRRTGEGGDGMALAGIILGWIGIGILSAVVLIPLFIAGVAAAAR